MTTLAEVLVAIALLVGLIRFRRWREKEWLISQFAKHSGPSKTNLRKIWKDRASSKIGHYPFT